MSLPLLLSRAFSTNGDRMYAYTAWFSALKYDPVRPGTYEVCECPGSDVARCRWTGKKWLPSTRLVGRISPKYWRGLNTPPAGSYNATSNEFKLGNTGATPRTANSGYIARRHGEFLSTPCECGGRNKNCFRCGGWGFIDSIGKGRATPSDFAADVATALRKRPKKTSSTVKLRRPLIRCPHCGVMLVRLQKHLNKVHGGEGSGKS